MNYEEADRTLKEMTDKYPELKKVTEKLAALGPGDRIRTICLMTLTQAARDKPEINYHTDIITKVLELVRQATIADTISLLLKSPLSKDQMALAIQKCENNIERIKPQVALLVEGMKEVRQ